MPWKIHHKEYDGTRVHVTAVREVDGQGNDVRVVWLRTAVTFLAADLSAKPGRDAVRAAIQAQITAQSGATTPAQVNTGLASMESEWP